MNILPLLLSDPTLVQEEQRKAVEKGKKGKQGGKEKKRE